VAGRRGKIRPDRGDRHSLYPSAIDFSPRV
jgi:hypothetical protein